MLHTCTPGICLAGRRWYFDISAIRSDMNQYFQAEYSVYVTVVVLCGAFGTSIVYPLLSLKLRVDDCVLGKLAFFGIFCPLSLV